MDFVVLLALVFGLAVHLTAHLGLLFCLLFFQSPRWRGLAALLVPPLAFLWGYRSGYRKTCWIWLASLATYGAAYGVAYWV